MAAKAKYKTIHKVRIGGTVDNDVADWLERTKGGEKFSTYLNGILREAMESEKAGPERSLRQFQSTLSKIEGKISTLQERLQVLEAGTARTQVAGAVRKGRGRPRKVRAEGQAFPGRTEEEAAPAKYDVRSDVNWYLGHDRYKKVKPEPLVNAFDMVLDRFDKGENITVGLFQEDYDQEKIGVPYPTFRLFYFPLIRNRLMEKRLIEKVDKPGKKGVYRKRT